MPNTYLRASRFVESCCGTQLANLLFSGTREMLNLNRVSKTYHTTSGTVAAVDQVDVTLNAGQFIAVQGPSGCGKSTVLLIAGGLLAPDEGEVRIGDCDPYALDANSRSALRAEQIGFVFQQFHLIPYLSVFENIIAPSITSGRSPVESAERGFELLGEFGLEHREDHTPNELSSGERQRVAMARALFNDPKLLLADEPTGNLDPANAEMVMSHLTAFAEKGGAVLLVTHDNAAAARAEKIIRLQDGQVEK
jgi:putative ABC transport system ATP-binding protein